MSDSLIDRDLRHVWHPCSQMKDYEAFPPLPIVGAQGDFLHLADGRKLIDAHSSWWCKSLGHGHPRLRAALKAQADRFEHVIGANTSQEPAVALAERLGSFLPGLSHVFYGGDGSTAVEIAAKMALHAQRLRGQPQRVHFAALSQGYHGESGISLGLSDLGLYREPYAALLPTPSFLRPLPYRSGVDTGKPLSGSRDRAGFTTPSASDWQDAGDVWPEVEAQLESLAPTLCAIAFEPVLQGAGGMRLYSPDLLRRLRQWSQANGVYLIADEILTGFYRTGPRLACEHAGIAPDFVCLSKGLTAGWLPLSATLVSDAVYELFYADYGLGRDFLHSNTYAGNALGCAVALEALQVYAEEGMEQRVRETGPAMFELFSEMAEATGVLTDMRHLGMVVAADLKPECAESLHRAGYAVFREAVSRGALWRHLGSTLYWLPPLNVERATLRSLRDIGIASLRAVFRRSVPVSFTNSPPGA
jgi:adenosylmethionine---8-amino-7-oxononanoate aminotransferase